MPGDVPGRRTWAVLHPWPSSASSLRPGPGSALRRRVARPRPDLVDRRRLHHQLHRTADGAVGQAGGRHLGGGHPEARPPPRRAHRLPPLQAPGGRAEGAVRPEAGGPRASDRALPGLRSEADPSTTGPMDILYSDGQHRLVPELQGPLREVRGSGRPDVSGSSRCCSPASTL